MTNEDKLRLNALKLAENERELTKEEVAELKKLEVEVAKSEEVKPVEKPIAKEKVSRIDFLYAKKSLTPKEEEELEELEELAELES